MSDFTFTQEYLLRLGVWTLALFAAEGAAIALVWTAWERRTRAAPKVRYRTLCLHFALLVAAPFATFAALHFSAVLTTPSQPALPVPAPTDALHAGIAWVTRVLRLLTLMWLLSPILMMAMTLRAWLGCRPSERPAPEALRRTVLELARETNLHRAPRVLEGDSRAPWVTGFLRTWLVLPPHFVERLTPGERRAVLLHEFAHLRRNDFGWNLLQCAGLSLVWVHPAARFLYDQMHREREIACDFDAVEHGARPADLARALVRLVDPAERAPLTMALASADGLLRERVLRLLDPVAVQKPGRVLEPAAAAVALAVLAIGCGASSVRDQGLREAYVASAFGPTLSIAAHDPAGAFEVSLKQGRVLAASVGRQPIAPEHILQSGDRVVVLGDEGRALVTLKVDPHGHIRWNPRQS